MQICYETSTAKKGGVIIFPFKKRAISPKIIAIGGLEHNCGTSCVCLAISNFLENKLRKKTAYIELNPTNQIASLSKEKKEASFRYLGIYMFPKASLSTLPHILQMHFDYFVLDFGILNPYTLKEFNRCNKKFLVMDLCLWKKRKNQEKLEQFIKENTLELEHVILLMNHLTKESTTLRFSKLFSKQISLPYIKNPFQLTPDDFKFYEKLLEEK